jgi:invasion protein IalB
MAHGFLSTVLRTAILVLPFTIFAHVASAGEVKAKAPMSGTEAVGTQSSVQEPMATKADAGSAASLSQPHLIEERYKDWSMQCVTDSSVTPACQIIYKLMSSNQKQVTLVLSLAIFRKDSARLQMALPLGFSLAQGVNVSFGKAYSMLAHVSRCTLQGCIVEGQGPAKMISAMLHEKSGLVSVRNMQGTEIKLPISLEGFTAAYDALKTKS